MIDRKDMDWPKIASINKELKDYIDELTLKEREELLAPREPERGVTILPDGRTICTIQTRKRVLVDYMNRLLNGSGGSLDAFKEQLIKGMTTEIVKGLDEAGVVNFEAHISPDYQAVEFSVSLTIVKDAESH